MLEIDEGTTQDMTLRCFPFATNAVGQQILTNDRVLQELVTVMKKITIKFWIRLKLDININRRQITVDFMMNECIIID